MTINYIVICIDNFIGVSITIVIVKIKDLLEETTLFQVNMQNTSKHCQYPSLLCMCICRLKNDKNAQNNNIYTHTYMTCT